MTGKMKRRLYRIIGGSLILLAAVLIPGQSENLNLILFLLAYLMIGGDVVKKAVRNIGRGQIFDENFLMSVATVGAFFVGDYPEAVAVMLFYQVGELFQSYAVNKSRKSISDLMDIRPDYADVKRDGQTLRVSPDEVQIGETIVIKPGEKIPLDGRILSGNASMDTRALTGESMPRDAGPGDEVISGCINLNSLIEVEVTKRFGESTVSKILDLVENAGSRKAEAENFITKFSRYYTPVVVGCAVLLAVLPPLFLQDGSFSRWVYRALTFLVISCPCALVISIPLSFFGGIGGAGRQGILVKGSNYLEVLSQVRTMVFDKTGTLTKGSFRVAKIRAVSGGAGNIGNTGDAGNTGGMGERELLELAACAESFSTHPISVSLLAEYGKEVDKSRIGEIKEISGHGVDAVVDKRHVLAGNNRLMEEYGVKFKDVEEPGTVVHIAVDGEYAGYIVIADEIKEDAGRAVADLKEAGVARIVMLTGDRRAVGEAVARELAIDEVHSQLLPGDKVDRVEKLLEETASTGKLAFVGDGINDAPVLARADLGIAMGGLGSDAAIEAADVVIMNDEPSKIAVAMRISRKTLRIVKENIVFAIGVKVLVLILAALGMASMWAAVFADVGVAVIAILNAIRALRA